jgi:hypothetical protein
MDTGNTFTVKICPKCGSSFTCTPADCWCSTLPPIMPMIENAECYCPDCLNAIIKDKLAAEHI